VRSTADIRRRDRDIVRAGVQHDVRSLANGRVQIFELNLGPGRRVFTRVLWADPDRDAR